MAWFRRSKEGISGEGQKKDMPDGQWTKCPGCGEIIHKKQLEQNLFCCPKCNTHFRIGSKEYFELLLDEGSFKEMDKKMRSVDVLNFVDTKPYDKRLTDTIKKTSLMDAVRTYAETTNRKVFFEYLLIDGVNDSEEIAEDLADIMNHPLYHVNLIKYHSTGAFQASPREQRERFKAVLERRRVPVTHRISFGEDIMAACGQLAGTKVN